MKPDHVTIIGLGVMGADIAAIFIANGCDVDAVQPDPEEAAVRQAAVQNAVEQLGITGPKGVLRTVRSYAEVAVERTALVIECVPENLALKRKVFTEVLEATPSSVPVVSNASGYRISDITEGLEGVERTAGMHFFLPAHLVPLVEVVKGERTDDAVMDRLVACMSAVGRAPVRVNRDTPGFLANRIQHALMREAFAVIDEGLATPEDVDTAVRFGFGFRYVAAGPILQKEMAGLDTQLEAGRTIYPGLCASATPSPGLQKLVDDGRHGMKNGAGFWQWPPEQADAVRRAYNEILVEAARLLRRSPLEGVTLKP